MAFPKHRFINCQSSFSSIRSGCTSGSSIHKFHLDIFWGQKRHVDTMGQCGAQTSRGVWGVFPRKRIYYRLSYMELVLWARPSHSPAFSSFRINTRRVGLAHCLYPFGSWLLNRMWHVAQLNTPCAHYLLHQRNGHPLIWLASQHLGWRIQTYVGNGPEPVYPERTKRCEVWGSGSRDYVHVCISPAKTNSL